MPSDEEKRKRKKKEEERKKQLQAQLERSRIRNIHERHKMRRKKDCMIGLPFIVAFQGDPAAAFYCNDIHSYELIPRTGLYPNEVSPFYRLKHYEKHHVLNIAQKVLVWQAA